MFCLINCNLFLPHKISHHFDAQVHTRTLGIKRFGGSLRGTFYSLLFSNFLPSYKWKEKLGQLFCVCALSCPLFVFKWTSEESESTQPILNKFLYFSLISCCNYYFVDINSEKKLHIFIRVYISFLHRIIYTCSMNILKENII